MSYTVDSKSTPVLVARDNLNKQQRDDLGYSVSSEGEPVNKSTYKRPELTVEQLFARGIEEWKLARETVKKNNEEKKTQVRLPKEHHGPLYDPEFDPGVDPDVETILAPNRPKIFESRSEDNWELPERLSVDGRGSNVRSSSSTETEGDLAHDSDALYKKESRRKWSIAKDAIRVIIVVTLAFILNGLPWFLLEDDIYPERVEIKNLTSNNICFFTGSTGLLDPLNPCPYRGYNSIDLDGHQCMYWSDVVGNKKWVAKLRNTKKNQSGVNPGHMLDLISVMMTVYDGVDFRSPYCRRLGAEGPSNGPLCFVKKDLKGKELDTPRLSECWIVPCSIQISNNCFKKLWENRKNLSST